MSRRPPARRAPGSVRIIAGTLRGSKLPVPDVAGLRPTPARLRETLFNWLAPMLAGTRCLDLFAGTGALGIEALSRGAAELVLVERDPALAAALVASLRRLRLSAARVEAIAAERFLRGTPRPFDVVFLDPPFAAGGWAGIATSLETGGWLADAALVYVEHPAGTDAAPPAHWEVWKRTRAGEVGGALWRRRALATEPDAGSGKLAGAKPEPGRPSS